MQLDKVLTALAVVNATLPRYQVVVEIVADDAIAIRNIDLCQVISAETREGKRRCRVDQTGVKQHDLRSHPMPPVRSR